MHHVPKHDKQEVTVDISLMNFIDDHMANASEASFKLAKKNPNRAKQCCSIRSWQDRLKSDAVPGGKSELLTALGSNPLSHGNRGNPPWLKGDGEICIFFCK